MKPRCESEDHPFPDEEQNKDVDYVERDMSSPPGFVVVFRRHATWSGDNIRASTLFEA
jgi:hypothetical protein